MGPRSTWIHPLGPVDVCAVSHVHPVAAEIFVVGRPNDKRTLPSIDLYSYYMWKKKLCVFSIKPRTGAQKQTSGDEGEDVVFFLPHKNC